MRLTDGQEQILRRLIDNSWQIELSHEADGLDPKFDRAKVQEPMLVFFPDPDTGETLPANQQLPDTPAEFVMNGDFIRFGGMSKADIKEVSWAEFDGLLAEGAIYEVAHHDYANGSDEIEAAWKRYGPSPASEIHLGIKKKYAEKNKPGGPNFS